MWPAEPPKGPGPIICFQETYYINLQSNLTMEIIAVTNRKEDQECLGGNKDSVNDFQGLSGKLPQ